MFYFNHFQTLSGKLSAFWHILYGKSIKRAFYVSNGKKRFCLEKVTFFHHLLTLSWKFSGFCRTFFCEFLKSAFLLVKINNLRKRFSFQKHFLINATRLAKKYSLFEESSSHDSQKCTLRVQWICWTIEGKDFFWKSLFTPFVDLERKKLPFCWKFSGVGSKFAIIVAANKIWVRKLTFPKLLFDIFAQWHLTFGLLAKIRDPGFQNCTK